MEPDKESSKEPEKQQENAVVQVKRRKRQALPPHLRNIIYSFLEPKDKSRMVYLCKQEYKFLGEWKLYADEEERLR